MTKPMINALTIENFKSIKTLELKPKRINLFVGKPNAGKSNILEALSLFSELSQSDLRDFIRFEKLRHVFYDGDIQHKVYVKAKADIKSHIATIEYVESEKNYRLRTQAEIPNRSPERKPNDPMVLIENDTNVSLTDTNTRVESDFGSIFKKYSFRKAENDSNNKGASFSSLQVPYGRNIYHVLETNPSLFEEVAGYFDQYGLSLLTQKKIGHRVFQLPYSLVADTLQRMIFYLAAVKTNADSILIFEEPETHSFPPYISQLATTIAESKSNQFFIATHSPYLFNTIIEETPKEEVAVFVVDYENHQTVAHSVPEEDYGEIIDYGIDIFFNIRRFTEKEIEQ